MPLVEKEVLILFSLYTCAEKKKYIIYSWYGLFKLKIQIKPVEKKLASYNT